ncbi:MAG: hypothetical protein ACI8QS_000787 [Planctomycetota bacterium]
MQLAALGQAKIALVKLQSANPESIAIDATAAARLAHSRPSRPARYRVNSSRGKLVNLGLDTGCACRGTQTAYSPELDALEVVTAKGAYAR